MHCARAKRIDESRTSRLVPRRARGAILLALFAGLSAVAWAQPATSPRIAYVDMKRLLDNAPQVAAGRERLAREFLERDAQLKQQEAKLVVLKRRQGAEATSLSVGDAAQLGREVATLERGIERLRGQLRSELGTRGAEELGRRWPEIQAVIVEFAREQKYDLVLQGPVLFAASSIDITDRVLERLRSAPAQPERASAPLVP